jgi:hypothetical protein
MSSVKITRARIQFRKNIELYFASYEKELQYKFFSNKKIIEDYSKRASLNKSNYLFLNNLMFLKYRDAIEHYKTQIFPSKGKNVDDITKIILLFFPHIIKSYKLELTEEYKSLDYFKPENLKFDTCNNNQLLLEKEIKHFFFNYEVLVKNEFLFHRREMIIYLENFLNIYTEEEINYITADDRKTFMLFHHFRPFIRPEDFIENTKEKL